MSIADITSTPSDASIISTLNTVDAANIANTIIITSATSMHKVN